MRLALIHIGKFLILFFLLLNLGGNSLFGNVLTETDQDIPLEREMVQKAQGILWAIRENPNPEISDPFEHLFFGHSGNQNTGLGQGSVHRNLPKSTEFLRDLRSLLGRQIHPTHFFW